MKTKQCEHLNTMSIELASGLSAVYDPLTVPGEECLDCGAYWEYEPEELENDY